MTNSHLLTFIWLFLIYLKFLSYPFNGATGNQIASRIIAEGWFDCSLRALVSAMAAARGAVEAVDGDRNGTGTKSAVPVAASAASAAVAPFRGVYRFNRGIKSPTSFFFKDFHDCDVIYLFGQPKDWWRERDFELSLQIQCRIAALARTGNPNAHGPGVRQLRCYCWKRPPCRSPAPPLTRRGVIHP